MKLTITYEHNIPINAFRWTPSAAAEPLHYHSSLEIGLCVSGKGVFYFGEKQYDVSTGDIFIANNLELHIARSDECDPSTYIFVNFDPRLLLEEEEALLLPFAYQSDHFDNCIPATSPVAGPLGALIEKMYQELNDKQEGYRSMTKSALLDLCVLLLRHYATGLSKSEWKRLTNSFRRIRPALALIDDRFREPIELSDVAESLGISPSRASRLFQQELGRSFKDHLLQLRINEAKRMLISTSLSAVDVCFESGFQSVASFYRLFKQTVGLAPLDYRNQYSVHAIIENAP
jgi:AraC-like DNA-binding protein